ncbi:MAG: hypothetical protein ACYCZO_13320 [Daejeonella sp.]
MANSLTNELLQLQKSRCGNKYAEIVDDYMKDMPERVTQTLNRPLNSINKNISILTRYRGRMLYNLEKRFYTSWKRLKKYTKQI